MIVGCGTSLGGQVDKDTGNVVICIGRISLCSCNLWGLRIPSSFNVIS